MTELLPNTSQKADAKGTTGHPATCGTSFKGLSVKQMSTRAWAEKPWLAEVERTEVGDSWGHHLAPHLEHITLEIVTLNYPWHHIAWNGASKCRGWLACRLSKGRVGPFSRSQEHLGHMGCSAARSTRFHKIMKIRAFTLAIHHHHHHHPHAPCLPFLKFTCLQPAFKS